MYMTVYNSLSILLFGVEHLIDFCRWDGLYNKSLGHQERRGQ